MIAEDLFCAFNMLWQLDLSHLSSSSRHPAPPVLHPSTLLLLHTRCSVLPYYQRMCQRFEKQFHAMTHQPLLTTHNILQQGSGQACFQRLVVGAGVCSYASRRFQPDIMAFRFRLFRDYVAGVQRYWTQSGDHPDHISLLLGRAAVEERLFVTLLVVIKPERPMLGIERALAAVVGSGRYRRPRVSGSLAVLHAYSFAQQLEMIGQTQVWVSGIGTNLMPALFLPAGAVVLVYSQPAPLLWQVTEQLCQSLRLAYDAIKALLRLY